MGRRRCEGRGCGWGGGAHAPASKQLRLTLRKSVPSRRSSRALKTPSSCTTMRRSTPSVSGQPWEGSRCVCESTCTTTTKGGEHRVGRRETKSGVSFEAAFVAACSVQAAVPECASVPECALGWVCFGWRASRASAGAPWSARYSKESPAILLDSGKRRARVRQIWLSLRGHRSARSTGVRRA